MNVLLLSSSLGVLIGYSVTAQLVENDPGQIDPAASWKWSFYVQIIAVIPIFLIIMFTPSRYLDLNISEEAEETEEGLTSSPTA